MHIRMNLGMHSMDIPDSSLLPERRRVYVLAVSTAKVKSSLPLPE